MTDQPHHVERQLLFGLTALQCDLLTREQLLAGFSIWLADKSQSFESVLSAHGYVQPDDRELVNRLVDGHLQRHGQDPHQSLVAVSRADATLTYQLEQLGKQDAETDLRTLEMVLDTQQQQLSTAEIETARGSEGRFRIIKQHARGGLGEVFLALDKELQREVALKEIQPRFADDPESRGRFVLEAEITGSLEHPAIVPVYGLGKYGDGRPYYAMRFLHGASLKQLTDEFFEKLSSRKSKVAFTRDLEWRRLLGHFVSICKAIEYAHSRGVIHRDIKPSNIMTGRFGEALVVDWGLAKVLGREEHRRDSVETTLRPRSGEGSSATMDGVAIGTPAFMSPEQAQGDLDAMGPASDVYSLGATLYYLLTGKAAFDDTSLLSVLERVRHGEFQSPLQVRSGLSKAIDAICRKAMALRPQDRYPSAQALADDLELWLADEPVSVYRGSLSERTARWMRRNRGLVQSTAIGLVLITLLSMIAAGIFLKLQTEADLQRHNALLAREAAEAARQTAEELADSNQRLAEREEAARREAEQLALQNGQLAAQEAAERERAVTLAEKMSVEADKTRRLSEFLIQTFQAADPIGQGAAPGFLPKEKGGELTAREMLALGAERAVKDPDLIRFPLSQAAVLDAIGDAYRQLGMFGQAEPLLVQALKIRREQLPADHPDLAASLHNLGWYFHERGNYPQATKLYDEALTIRRQLPGDEGQRLTANTLHNKAWMLANEGWVDEAEELVRESYEIRRKVLGSTHRDTVFSQFALTFVLIEQGKFAEAALQLGFVRLNLSNIDADPRVRQAAFQFALGVINRELIGLQASESHLRTALQACIEGLGEDNVYVAVIRCELGTTLQEMQRLDEAREQFQGSLEISRARVSLEHPRIVILIRRYGDLLIEQGEPEVAKQLWNEFIDAQKGRFDAEYGQVVSAVYEYGQFLKDIKEFNEAADAFREVQLAIDRSAAEGLGYRYEDGLRGDSLNQQGLCRLDGTGQLDAAAALFRESVAEFEQELLSQPDNPTLLRSRVWPQLNLALTLLQQQQFGASSEALDQAEEMLKKVDRSASDALDDYWLETKLKLASAQQQIGSLPGLAQALMQQRAGDGSDLMELASELCSAISSTEPQDSQRAAVVDAAIESIRQALAAGYDRSQVTRWKRLAILDGEPAYQQLLEE